MKNNIFVITLFLSALFWACEGDKLEPMDNNKVPPGQVTITNTEELPGRVRLTYLLPDDPDLLYVKAVYKLNSGVMREIKASYYTNSMILDGFGAEMEYEVMVYSVNRSEVASEPVTVKVNPRENPIWEVRRSLNVTSDFSGFKIMAENPNLESVAIEMMLKDSLDTWQNIGSVQSELARISDSYRGLDTLTYEVRFTVRDRFLNYTDTLYTTVDPLFEKKLDKSKWREYNLPGDAKGEQNWLPMNLMWDNGYDYTYHYRWLTASPTYNELMISTFDIGEPALLSRFVLFNWGNDIGGMGNSGDRMFYQGEHLRYFQIWGSNNPDTDGSLEPSWTKLADFEDIKPSGLPIGQQSKEDFDRAVNGIEFEFPIENGVKIRYVRIVNLGSWGGSTKFGIVEIDLYGDPR